jgi:hypothetical protein
MKIKHDNQTGYNFLVNDNGKPCICPYKQLTRATGQDNLGRVAAIEILQVSDYCADHCPMHENQGNQIMIHCAGRIIDLDETESHPHEIGAGPDTPKIIMP